MNFKGVLIGIIATMIVILLCLLGCAMAVFWGFLSEKNANTIVFCGIIFAVMIGSILASKSTQRRILLHAISIFIIFSAILIITAYSMNGDFSLHLHTAMLLLSTLAAAVIGAVIGK